MPDDGRHAATLHKGQTLAESTELQGFDKKAS